MKWLIRLCSTIIAVCLFFVLLINAFDYAIYYRPDFYAKTFIKYDVPDYAKMELSEIVKVTDYLIDYLKGREDSLEHFHAEVNGSSRIFYSQRELLHMADVRVLFQIGLWVRRSCMIVGCLLVIILLLLKTSFIKTLLRCIIGTFLTLLGILGILALVIAADFNRAFIAFHHIFFRNELWQLDPDTDWVIRLLPEGFFLDMVIVIAAIFALSLLLTVGICFACLKICSSRRRLCPPNNV